MGYRGSDPRRPATYGRREACVEKLAADTPRTTAGGATFTAPQGVVDHRRRRDDRLLAPDGDSRVAIVESSAADPMPPSPQRGSTSCRG